MKVEFLGTGGFFANERRHTAGVLLPEAGLLFDAGSGLFRLPPRLQKSELDIFLSHAHLDHICGLPSLLIPLMKGTLTEVRVHGRTEVLDAVQKHLLAEAVFPIDPGFRYIELEEEFDVSGGGRLTTVPLQHPGGSTGFRIDWPDHSLAYITDTCVDGRYTRFIDGVDLLIHECYFPDELAEWGPKTGHSHTSQVAQLAVDAQVGRLLLIHIDPTRADDDPIGLETARDIFAATEMTEDGMVISVGPSSAGLD